MILNTQADHSKLKRTTLITWLQSIQTTESQNSKTCVTDTRTRAHTHMHTQNRHACTHAHTHTQTHTRTHARTHTQTRMHARPRTHTHTRTHAPTNTHTCACTPTHTRTHARTNAHARTHTHTRTRTHAHAHAHTHTHTHTHTNSCGQYRVALRFNTPQRQAVCGSRVSLTRGQQPAEQRPATRSVSLRPVHGQRSRQAARQLKRSSHGQPCPASRSSPVNALLTRLATAFLSPYTAYGYFIYISVHRLWLLHFYHCTIFYCSTVNLQ